MHGCIFLPYVPNHRCDSRLHPQTFLKAWHSLVYRRLGLLSSPSPFLVISSAEWSEPEKCQLPPHPMRLLLKRRVCPQVWGGWRLYCKELPSDGAAESDRTQPPSRTGFPPAPQTFPPRSVDQEPSLCTSYRTAGTDLHCLSPPAVLSSPFRPAHSAPLKRAESTQGRLRVPWPCPPLLLHCWGYSPSWETQVQWQPWPTYQRIPPLPDHAQHPPPLPRHGGLSRCNPR